MPTEDCCENESLWTNFRILGSYNTTIADII